jgi:hypothetical protein
MHVPPQLRLLARSLGPTILAQQDEDTQTRPEVNNYMGTKHRMRFHINPKRDGHNSFLLILLHPLCYINGHLSLFQAFFEPTHGGSARRVFTFYVINHAEPQMQVRHKSQGVDYTALCLVSSNCQMMCTTTRRHILVGYMLTVRIGGEQSRIICQRHTR